MLERMAQSLDTSPDEIEDKLYRSIITELDRLKKEVRQLEAELVKKTAESLLPQAEEVKGVTVLAARVPHFNTQSLRETCDLLRGQLRSGIIVLGSVYQGNPVFVASVTPDLVTRGYHAGEIVKQVTGVAGGGGGGSARLAQAGGKYKDKIDEALRLVRSLI
jgi:alanyl-tRNA synthetase